MMSATGFDTQGTLLWRNHDPETHWHTPRLGSGPQSRGPVDKEFEAGGAWTASSAFTTPPYSRVGPVAYFGQPSSGVYAQAKQRAWAARCRC